MVGLEALAPSEMHSLRVRLQAERQPPPLGSEAASWLDPEGTLLQNNSTN